MPDLDRRFRGLDRVRGRDLWPDIETREPRLMPDRSPGRRAAVAAVALALAAVGVAVAIRAFVGRDAVRPGQPAPSPAAPVEPVVDVTLPIEWPSSIVYGEGSIWVAASANDRTGAGTVSRIDPDTAEVLAEIPVPSVPGWETGGGGMEAEGGSLWIAGSLEGQAALVGVDVTTNRVTEEITLGGQFAGDVAIDERGVWVSIFGRSEMELVRVDPATGLQEARISLPSEYAREVLAVAGTIWVHEHETHGSVVGASLLTQVDPENDRVVRSVEVGSQATSVTEGDGAIWATTWTSQDGNLLVRLDPVTGALETVPAGSFDYLVEEGEGGLWGRGLDQPSGRLGIARFNPLTGRVDATVALDRDQTPIALAVAPGSVWVARVEGGATRVELRPA